MDYPYITSILWSHLKVPLASQVVSHLSSAASRFVALELHGSVVRVAKPRGGNRGGRRGWLDRRRPEASIWK